MTVGSWRVRAGLAAALAAATVAGCSAQSGAAAVVDGEAIPVSDVQEATGELTPYLTDLTPSTVLLLLVAEPTFARVAQENGIGVSEQEALEVLDTLSGGDQRTGPVPDFGPAAVTVARFTLLQQGLQNLPNGPELLQQVSGELAELDIEVNPRYGAVDFSESNAIAPVERDWLVPAATDAP